MKNFFYLVQRLGLVVFAGIMLAGQMARAQAPAWQSVIALGANSQVNSTATDGVGNVYVTGYFNTSISLGNITLTSNGGYDAFVAKWSPASGTFVWAQNMGGAGDDNASALAVNGNSIYVTGNFSGSGSFGAALLTSAGDNDVFVTKLTDAGTSSTFIWTQRLGGRGSDSGNALAVSGGGVFVVGEFNGLTISVGTIVLTNGNNSPGSITYNAYVAKIVDAGSSSSFAWAQLVSSFHSNFGMGVAVSGSAVYISGNFSHTAAFGNISKSSVSISIDAYVAKLTDSGTSATFSWVETGGGYGSDFAWRVATQGSAVFLSGAFMGSATFGATVLASTGGSDAFVVKYLDNGTNSSLAWVQQIGGTGNQFIYGMQAMGPSIYVSGLFEGTITVGALSFTSAGLGDIWVAKLTDAGTTGSTAWVQQAGGAGNDVSVTLFVTPDGSIKVGGRAVAPATFGPLALGGSTGTPIGFLSSFLDPVATANTPGHDQQVNLNISPNPAHNRATVQLPAIPGTTTATLTVLDALGRTLHTQPATTNARTELDLTGLAPGLYAVQVQAGGRTTTQRLMVE